MVHMRTISDMLEFKDVHDIQGYHSYHVLSALAFGPSDGNSATSSIVSKHTTHSFMSCHIRSVSLCTRQLLSVTTSLP